MNYNELKNKLMTKVEQELLDYQQNLVKNNKPEEIIEHAGEISLKEDIKDMLDCLELEEKEIKLLIKIDNPLEKIYSECVEKENIALDILRDNISSSISDISKQHQKSKEKER